MGGAFGEEDQPFRVTEEDTASASASASAGGAAADWCGGAVCTVGHTKSYVKVLVAHDPRLVGAVAQVRVG